MEQLQSHICMTIGPSSVYGEIFAHFLINQESLPLICLCNCSTKNFLMYEENVIFFLSVYMYLLFIRIFQFQPLRKANHYFSSRVWGAKRAGCFYLCKLTRQCQLFQMHRPICLVGVLATIVLNTSPNLHIRVKRAVCIQTDIQSANEMARRSNYFFSVTFLFYVLETAVVM